MQQLLTDTIHAFRTFTLAHWRDNLFSATPPYGWDLRGLYAALVLILLVAGIVVQFLPLYRPYKERWQLFLWANFVITLVLFFLRFERIPYLGTDLLRAIHEIVMIMWLNSIIWYRRTTYREDHIEEAITSRRSKYLPKPKKNRPHM